MSQLAPLPTETLADILLFLPVTHFTTTSLISREIFTLTHSDHFLSQLATHYAKVHGQTYNASNDPLEFLCDMIVMVNKKRLCIRMEMEEMECMCEKLEAEVGAIMQEGQALRKMMEIKFKMNEEMKMNDEMNDEMNEQQKEMVKMMSRQQERLEQIVEELKCKIMSSQEKMVSLQQELEK